MLLTVRAVADETASPDNSQAITESPQSEPPGFQVNPPVHDNTRGQQMVRCTKWTRCSPTESGGTQQQAKQSCCFAKKPSLPVNDNGVWGCFVSVATTFLVTASAAEQLQRAVLKQTSALFFSHSGFAATMHAFSKAEEEEAGKATPTPHPATGGLTSSHPSSSYPASGANFPLWTS